MVATTVFLLAVLAAQGLSGKSDTTPTKQPFDPKKWKLAWNDEFKSGRAPNPAKWGYEEGYIRNNEAQYYTKGRLENARIEHGKLVIEGRLDNWEGKKITSASITTEGKKEFLYGRIEVRAKIPTGKGTWPAIWTLGPTIHSVGWPKCGELDILENVGFDPSRVHANIHCDAYNHVKRTGKGNSIDAGKPWEDFHVYAIEWYRDRIEFFYDDIRYNIFRKEAEDDSKWPFDKPQFLILNLAIGGAWGGSQGIDESLFPHRFEIDYVRYYTERK